MKKAILKEIEDFNSIVISRHKSPDLDAYGSQFGLYHALKNAFPEKKIYVVGDTNRLNSFGEFDLISDDILKESLLFVLDTVARQMLLNDIHDVAKKVVLFDHHQNEPDIRFDYYLRNTEASSTSEIVADFLETNHIEIPLESAKALFMGIVGDTGRFMYSSTKPLTFRIVANLLETGFDMSKIYNDMYTETFASKKVKADFFSTISLTKNNVAYRKNDVEFLKKYQMDSASVSRGLVGQMAGIKEVPIWVNFTYDTQTDKILCEFRSREIEVLKIAQNHGGGGHLHACGCSVLTWDETDIILKELDQLLEDIK